MRTYLVPDACYYEPNIHFDELRANGVDAIILRTGCGVNNDTAFKALSEAALAADLKLMVYHWFDPIYTVERQVALVKAATQGLPVAAFFVDAEQWWSDWIAWYRARREAGVVVPRFPANVLSAYYKKAAAQLDAAVPATVAVYSSPNCINFSAYPMDWAANYYIWLAQYRVQISGAMEWNALRAMIPTYPLSTLRGVPAANIMGHQFSDALRMPGIYSPAGTRCAVDMSAFEPSWLAALKPDTKFYPSAPPLVAPPVVPISDTGNLQFKALHRLNVRSGPGTNYGIVGSLPIGAIAEPKNVGGSESWIEVANGWVAVYAAGQEHMRIVP